MIQMNNDKPKLITAAIIWLSVREEANKPADDTRSVGLFTYGEYGLEYGYFKHLRKLTEQESFHLLISELR